MKHVVTCMKVPVILTAFILAGCVSDPNYSIESLDKIDTDIKVFGEGIELPLGQTEAISLGQALKMAGSGDLDSLLKKDSKGDYSITANGNYNLDGVIKDLHLEQLRDINGVSFTKDVEYKIGDFDAAQFKIDGQEFSYAGVELGDLHVDDIPVPEFASPDQVIKAELYKYLPENMNVGEKLGNIEHSVDLLDIGDIQDPILEMIPGDTETSIQPFLSKLGKTDIQLDYQTDLSSSISFGENASKIADVSNFRLKDGGMLKVELEMQNCPMTKGRMTPNLKLDMSSMMVLANAVGGKLDLSSIVLNNTNSWKAEKSFPITSLADGFPRYDSGKLAMNGSLAINGNILIEDAASTPNKIKQFSDKKLTLKVKVSLGNVVIDEMDITLGSGVGYSVNDIDMPIDISYNIPQTLKAVNKVCFDPNRKLEVSIDASGLGKIKSIDGLKHISAIPELEISFPAGLEIAEAVDGKVKIKGEDLYEGKIDKRYTLVSLTPVNDNDKLSFKGNVTAKVNVGISGTFSSKHLPSSEADDIVVTARISCKPAITDYDVTLNKAELTKQFAEENEFSFNMDGMADFGTFRISPKNNPKATLEFDIPQTSKIDIVAENLVITIPELMTINGSGLSGFDPVKNTLTINGRIPQRIELPIQSLLVTPQTGNDGKTVVKGTFAIKGGITISDTEITRKTLDEVSNRKVNIKAAIPTLEAQSISMEGDFSKSLDYDGKNIVILDSEAMKNFPQEVKSFEDITLDKVNAIIEIKVDGLPNMQGKFYLKGTKIQLPSFLFGSNDSNTLILNDQIEISDGKVILQTAPLTALKNVQLTGRKEITGDIKFVSTLYSHKPVVDISTLKSTIKASIKIGVGNGPKAETPGKIAISKAIAKVGYNLEEKQSLALGDIPEELKGEDIILALNPEMHLELRTNLGAPVKGSIKLTPYIGGKAFDGVTINNIELPYSDDWNKTKTNKYAIGSKASAGQDETLIATDLSPLLRAIPDSIVLDMNINIDENKSCIIFPEAAYTCEMKYDFGIPLSFGDGFNISKAIDIDVDASINDYLKMADIIKLSGTYQSSLPIQVQADVLLLDPDGRVIELKEPIGLTLGKSDDGKTAKEGTFETVIAVKEPQNINLRKLRLNLNVKSTPNVCLNDSQFIQLADIKLALPKGININSQK